MERHAGGVALEALLSGRLGIVTPRLPGIELRTTEKGQLSVIRVDLVRKKETLKPENLDPLLDSGLRKAQILDILADQVPSLTESRSVVAEDLRFTRNEAGGRFLSLAFNPGDARALGDERADTWEVLEEAVGHSLVWKRTNPNMRLFFASSEIPSKTFDTLSQFVRLQLPLAVELEPALKPRSVLG